MSSIEIKIKTPAGETYLTVTVDAAITVAMLKSVIECRTGRLLPENSFFSDVALANFLLDGRKSLADYGIVGSCAVLLHGIPQPPADGSATEFEIGVSWICVREYTFRVRDSDKIGTISEKIYEAGHWLLPECGPLQLWFRGERLDFEKTVGDYGIRRHPGDTIVMVFDFGER